MKVRRLQFYLYTAASSTENKSFYYLIRLRLPTLSNACWLTCSVLFLAELINCSSRASFSLYPTIESCKESGFILAPPKLMVLRDFLPDAGLSSLVFLLVDKVTLDSSNSFSVLRMSSNSSTDLVILLSYRGKNVILFWHGNQTF